MMTNTISKDQAVSGWINGFIGVLLFSGSMPATKLAVMEMDPIFVTIARAVIAGILGSFCFIDIKKNVLPKTVILSGSGSYRLCHRFLCFLHWHYNILPQRILLYFWECFL
jgi:prepilin signal peptidase PulO-like enzyme (type II secretory pathway)